MRSPSVSCLTSARIPTSEGQFRLRYYENSLDDKEHLALVLGEVQGRDDVLVRIHSECFTGDVLGSLRCDCGEQLHKAMHRIAREGCGILLYLRQEGRGIGLQSKLEAYNLQDEGFDTVEANRELGHGVDERDYTVGALMLRDMGIRSVRLLTNNPAKIDGLEENAIRVRERVGLEAYLHAENEQYLQTKVERMEHLLRLGPLHAHRTSREAGVQETIRQRAEAHFATTGRPFVTLSYAQSLDGSIAAVPGERFALSGRESLVMTHEMRAMHDAILVGIGTVLADDPRLTVRHVEGTHPRPVVLDSGLRMPAAAELLSRPGPAPIIATGDVADAATQEALEAAGATLLRLPVDEEGYVRLEALLHQLGQMGHRSVMVEGGAEVITSFLSRRLVDHMVITLANRLIGGLPAVQSLNGTGGAGRKIVYPRLRNLRYRWLNEDLVLRGDPEWGEQKS